MTEARVHLVGAGPGDPDLLTVKALRLIRAADVIVYDRLVGRGVLDLASPTAERVFVGKAPRHHSMTQDEINALLVHLARTGQRVVRLKGGDPFIFGRGSEEALTLAEHGIAFDIVPGVTAAAGCGAYAGIPLTHRGLATGVRFVTGHCREDAELDLNWASLADSDTTLVLYMALQNIDLIARRLIEAGLSADTPAALVANGTTAEQQRIVATLGTLAEAAARHAPPAPCLIIVGRVVSLVPQLDWPAIPAKALIDA
jgi:uroporphyrin-III C-methyltransferase/precorrin-2 dehydrogenase/sirohydrochlorin ferrochelatase/uroporphyrin-III C-methyltransferase